VKEAGEEKLASSKHDANGKVFVYIGGWRGKGSLSKVES